MSSTYCLLRNLKCAGIINMKNKLYAYLTCTCNGGIVFVIIDFADKETEKVFNQVFSKRIPHSIQRIALRKLIMLDNANGMEDIRVPPSNHLEKLSGKLDGKWSIRINDQWRICFIPCDDWKDYKSVEIVDYH